jgi:Na+/H+ antiporter NhaC
MCILKNFIPILLFVTIFFGSGLYFALNEVENAFYQIPATAAILPSIVVAWIMYRKNNKQTMYSFLDGARHPDIITMCMIFLLAGALSSVTKSIGSVESTVNFALSITPEGFLLVGVFIISALISTAIGTSMGTIAALASLVTQLSSQGAFSIEIGAATLVSGAMFGDNMSVISDTTIASVSSQNANLKDKLKLNIRIASISSIITIFILILADGPDIDVIDRNYNIVLIFPYLFLIILASIGLNVFVVLVFSLIFSGMIGIIFTDYPIMQFAQDTSRGFHEMHDIMLLSILIGGLSGLSNQSSEEMAKNISKFLPKNAGKKTAQLFIAFLVSLFDILLANNVVAIIFSGDIARALAEKYKIKPHESAAWLDIFSCVFQGIIPHGAQILLVCAIAHTSPLEVISKVYYCYVLALVTITYILLVKSDDE